MRSAPRKPRNIADRRGCHLEGAATFGCAPEIGLWPKDQDGQAAYFLAACSMPGRALARSSAFMAA